MAYNPPETISFRPREDLQVDFEMLWYWTKRNNSTFNSLINSFLPAIAYAIQNSMFEDENGNRYIRADFGDVVLLEPNHLT